MKPPVSVIICTALVCAAAIGARLTANESWNSVVSYHTPYVFQGRLETKRPPRPVVTDDDENAADPAEPEPIVDRALLVIIDGLRVDHSKDMPALNQLRAQGASGVMRVGSPSLSNPARAVMATGSWQEVNGVTNNSHYVPPKGRSIFSNANAVGIPVALATIDFTHDNYGKFAGENLPKFGIEPHDQGVAAVIAYQHKQCDAITAFLKDSQAKLMVADLTAIDIISHDEGAVSDDARKVRAEVDTCLGRVVESVDLEHTVVFVTSDHGHIDTGGHGGLEDVVMNVPFVMAGQNVRHLTGLKAQQVDIAPTICELLNIPLPPLSQGRFLWEAIQLSSEDREAVEARVAQQRATFQQVQRDVLGGGDREGAPARAAEGRKRSATWAVVAMGLAAIGISIFALQGWSERLRALLAVGIYFGLYRVLFQRFHLGYSLSEVNREEFLTRFLTNGMLISGIAVAVALLIMIGAKGYQAWRRSAAVTSLVCLGLMASVDWLYYNNGFVIRNFMFDIGLAFHTYLDLLAIIALPFGMAAATLVLVAVGRLTR